MGVDQEDLESSRFQDLKQGDPVHARTLHRHGLDVAGLQPVGRGMKIFRKRCKAAYRLRIAIRRHGDVDLRRPNIHPAAFGFRQYNMGAPVFCLPFRFLDMGPSALDLTMRDGPDCAELSTLLIGIDAPGYQAAVTTVLSTESGTMLGNGLPEDAPLVFRPTCRHAWARSSYCNAQFLAWFHPRTAG